MMKHTQGNIVEEWLIQVHSYAKRSTHDDVIIFTRGVFRVRKFLPHVIFFKKIIFITWFIHARLAV